MVWSDEAIIYYIDDNNLYRHMGRNGGSMIRSYNKSYGILATVILSVSTAVEQVILASMKQNHVM